MPFLGWVWMLFLKNQENERCCVSHMFPSPELYQSSQNMKTIANLYSQPSLLTEHVIEGASEIFRVHEDYMHTNLLVNEGESGKMQLFYVLSGCCTHVHKNDRYGCGFSFYLLTRGKSFSRTRKPVREIEFYVFVPRNCRSPYTLDLEKKLTCACIGLLGGRGL